MMSNLRISLDVSDFPLGALLPFREVDFPRFRVEIFCTETALKTNNSIQH